MAPRDVERTFADRLVEDEGSETNSIVSDKKAHTDTERLSNEYVLNVAFLSFVGFLLVQAVFALIANSQAMLADSEAMSVDALTYLFNLMAERVKTRPFSASELELPEKQRSYQRELQRLYLELIPPALSIMTLIAVTVMTLKEAFSTLFGSSPMDSDGDGDVSVPIMLLFSGANLLLDIVNVSCFAQANSIYGLDITKPSSRKQTMELSEDVAHECTHLLHSDARVVYDDADDVELVNLNMCSAWTVRSSCLYQFTFTRERLLTLMQPFSHCSTACLRRHHAVYRRSDGGYPGYHYFEYRWGSRRLDSRHCCVAHHFHQYSSSVARTDHDGTAIDDSAPKPTSPQP